MRGSSSCSSTATRRRRRSPTGSANWKIVVENSVECYHCHIAHPELVDLVDMKLFEQETLPYGFVQRSPLADEGERRTEDGAAYDYPAGAVREGGYHFLWPNFYFLVYPGPGNVSSLCFYPRGVDRTEVVRDFYYAPSVGEQERREVTAFIDTIQRQDAGLCEGVQRGLRGGGFTQGRLQLHDLRLGDAEHAGNDPADMARHLDSPSVTMICSSSLTPSRPPTAPT